MPRKRAVSVDERRLTKGQLRKLETLRKQLGPEIADKAFAEWLSATGGQQGGPDRNAEMIAEAVMDLVRRERLNIPRGGYIVRRGRGRVIVERPAAA